MSPWISAFRPRTLPLALASIFTAGFLARAAGQLNGPVVVLAALTTVLLQVLSNLANDYGDSQNGADSVHRQGPQRAVQSGAITPAQMLRAIWICGLLALGSGLALLWVALGAAGLGLALGFLALGLAAIWAAVNYTAGSRPYGYAGQLNGPVVALAALTTVLLQVLSNLANDYGDSQNGADSIHRQGPQRAVQSGAISPAQMLRAMWICGALALFSGLGLLWQALGAAGLGWVLAFLALGLAAIWAAVNYTAGSRPYGYAGLGDLSVFIFFGLAGVCGTYFLQTQTLPPAILLPAAALGFFATAVLNVNNIRDINSDVLAGKITIPVRLGAVQARRYHGVLLLLGLGCAAVFVALSYRSPWQWLFVAAAPLLLYNGYQVWQRQEPLQIDPLLKQMALSTLVFTLLFGIGQLL